MNRPCCCQKLPGQRNVMAPFDRIVALGFYDGPTAGVLRCGECTMEYRFETIDWDSGQNTRIVSLAPLRTGSLDRVIRRCPGGLPSWPMWCPLWQFESTKEQ